MSGVRWQERRLLITVVLLTALGTTAGVLTIFKVTNPWVISAATIGVPVIVLFSGLALDRYKRILSMRDDRALKLQDGCLVLSNGRLPKVAQIDDPVQLGVHPAINFTSVPDLKPPVYVPRDIDEQVREQLATGGFVLLVGDSTAGKSRTAFEIMRTSLPDHVLIAPHDRSALLVAIEHTVRVKQAVLWLSDLEHYVGTGGLTRENIARLTGGNGHRVILATLRSAEYARLSNSPPDLEEAARAVGREVREALEQARVIRLERMFTAGELQRARAKIWDIRIASALQQANEFGIAEYLASGPELQRDYANAWDVGVNPRGAALVAAAIDCRRAGYTNPLPRRLLEDLHSSYLEAKGGNRLQPESLDQAWDWATQRRRATTALLSPNENSDNNAVVVFDYLVDLRACLRRVDNALRISLS